MRSISFEELKSLLSDARNTEKKKTLCLILGVFVAAVAIIAGITIFLKRSCCCEDETIDDYWDDEEEYFDDDFDTEEEPAE